MITTDEVRDILRSAEMQYNDVPPSEEFDGWIIKFWGPIRDYNFDNRTGLTTSLFLFPEGSGDVNINTYMRMVVLGVYSAPLGKLHELQRRINQLNRNAKLTKWFTSSFTNEDGIEELYVSVSVEIDFSGDAKLSSESFWRCHGAIWGSITHSWPDFAEILGISTSRALSEIGQKAPEDLTPGDKEKLLEMFGKYLDEQFDNQ